MKKTLTLSQRIAAGYIMLVLFMATTCLVILSKVRDNRQTGVMISDVIVPGISLLETLSGFIPETGALTQRIRENPDPEDLAALNDLHRVKYPALRKQFMQIAGEQPASESFTKNIPALFLECDRLIKLQKDILAHDRGKASSGQAINQQEWLWSSTYRNRTMAAESKIKSDLSNLLSMETSRLDQCNRHIKNNNDWMAAIIILFMMISLTGGIIFTYITSRRISKPIQYLKDTMLSMSLGEIPEIVRTSRDDEMGQITHALVELTGSLKKKTSFAVETGKGNYNTRFNLLSDHDELGLALVEMNKSLRRKAEEMQKESWLKSGITRMNDILRNEHSNTGVLYTNIISFLSGYLVMNQGALYLVKEDREKNTYFEMVAGFACDKNRQVNKRVSVSEGYVGQVAAEKKMLVMQDVPGDYFKVSSGLGEALPRTIIVMPLLFEKELKGVVELASFSEVTPMQLELLEQLSSIIAATFDLIDRKINTELLLFESQELNEKLMEQEDALRKSNDDLVEKGKLLKISEEELKEQQEELMQTNTQLEEKAQLLAEQNEEIRMKNEQLEIAKEAIRIKAEELENTSRYKSEFLANMSHELRTPLNSILILANLFNENREGNLTEKQLEYARVVKRSGSDLLNLINDILDLSKIESRNMELEISEIPLQELGSDMSSMFRELALEKKVGFQVNYEQGLPGIIRSDKMRIEQILKNLLSNAFKFTDKNGSVTITFAHVPSGWQFHNICVDSSRPMISISVKDTGIGIPAEKQQLIFEAFKQADGSTSRKYGGTGLGLSISRELSVLLKGEIQIRSIPGEGSEFTLFIPVDNQDETPGASTKTKSQTIAHSLPADQPGNDSPVNEPGPEINLSQADRLLLIIEDDPDFARLLQNQATRKGFTGMIASRGDTGLINAKRFRPDAIILDLNLPGMDGWSVMRRLKADPELKHIPVHILSGQDYKDKSVPQGAVEVMQKPVNQEQLNGIFENLGRNLDKRFKKVLVIEDNPSQNDSIRALLDNPELECYSALNGKEAMDLLEREHIDLITLDLTLPDIQGLELLKQIKNTERWKELPVIIYTGKNLSMDENRELSRYSQSIIVKTERSFERLLNEANLFLKRLDEGCEDTPDKHILNPVKNPEITKAAATARQAPLYLKGKKVLLVDDDIRNIFAMTSILEEQECTIVVANDGREALNMLNQHPDTDFVLMDIMMPEMDGYEAMKQIRAQEKYFHLPIVALTAKAMKGDKERCMEAGASDYLSKPVDPSKLISMINVLLFQ